MISPRDSSGGRIIARRMLVPVTAIFLCLIGGVLLAATADSESSPNVTVREEHGVYSVEARFQVPQSPVSVFEVLTDYEDIPRFMPQIKTSVVLARAAGRAVVQQEAVSHWMTFSKKVHLVLEISEGSDTVRFRDRCGQSFARYEGVWRVSEQNGGTEIVYELVAQPSFDIPEFLLKRLLKRDSMQMVEQLKREIASRSSR